MKPSMSTKAMPEELQQERRLMATDSLMSQLFDAVPCAMLVLNQQRQIVYKNSRGADLLGQSDPHKLIGKLPGDFFGCCHASENGSSSCGSTNGCSTCGSQKAILNCMYTAKPVTEECRIRTTSGKSLDLRVSVTPFTYSEKDYLLYSFLDIASEKRRQALEKLLLFDIGQSLEGITLSSELIERCSDSDEKNQIAGILKRASDKLYDQVDQQKSLINAENGNLDIQVEKISSSSFIRECVRPFKNFSCEGMDGIYIEEFCENFSFYSDRYLLYKIIHEMLNNAIEASKPGDCITLSCLQRNQEVELSVISPEVMPTKVQLQVFQRSFTTKGSGRGLGTYSMKLFGERYLKGQVGFSSTKEEGTVFSLTIPLHFPRYR